MIIVVCSGFQIEGGGQARVTFSREPLVGFRWIAMPCVMPGRLPICPMTLALGSSNQVAVAVGNVTHHSVGLYDEIPPIGARERDFLGNLVGTHRGFSDAPLLAKAGEAITMRPPLRQCSQYASLRLGHMDESSN